jgi:hypothetical protein
MRHTVRLSTHQMLLLSALVSFAAPAVAENCMVRDDVSITVSSDRDVYLEGMTAQFTVTIVREDGRKVKAVQMNDMILTAAMGAQSVALVKTDNMHWSVKPVIAGAGVQTLTVVLKEDNRKEIARLQREIAGEQEDIDRIRARISRERNSMRGALEGMIRAEEREIARMLERIADLDRPLAQAAKAVAVHAVPRISLAGPAGGGACRGQVSVLVDSTSTLPGRAELLVDGATVQAMETVPGAFSFVIDTAALADGPHAVSARLTLAAFGFSAQAAPAGVIFDNTPPAVASLSPVNGSTTDASEPVFSAVWSDTASGVDLASVSVLLDGEDVTSAAGVTAEGFSFSPASPLTQGVHTLSVEVADLAGNLTSVLTVVDYEADKVVVLYGDADQNGIFDWNDLLTLTNWLVGPPPPMPAPGTLPFIASDVNGDGMLDWLDYSLFQDKLTGAISRFPVEP